MDRNALHSLPPTYISLRVKLPTSRSKPVVGFTAKYKRLGTFLGVLLLMLFTGYGYAEASGMTNMYDRRAMASIGFMFSNTYGKYDSRTSSWITNHNGGSFSVVIRSIDRLQTESGVRIHVVAENVKSKDYDCHACSGLLGLFILEIRDKETHVIASLPKISSGSWGEANGGMWVRLNNSGYYGYRIDGRDGNQGTFYAYTSIYAPYGKEFREILRLTTGYSDEGTGHFPSISYETKLRVDNLVKDAKFAPVVAEVSRTTKQSEKAKEKKETFKWTLHFDEKTWEYKVPKDWPDELKN